MAALASELSGASAPYCQDVTAVVGQLASDASRGLFDGEAASRIQQYGRNELAVESPCRRGDDSAISAALWAYERDAALPYEAIAIFAVVLLNAMMSYVQESRAEAAVAALRAMSAAAAKVIRGGERRSIPATEIAPGDIILIEEGDTIPSGRRLIECIALQTAEAALTGESLPVTKDMRPLRRTPRSAIGTTWSSAGPSRRMGTARPS